MVIMSPMRGGASCARRPEAIQKTEFMEAREGRAMYLREKIQKSLGVREKAMCDYVAHVGRSRLLRRTPWGTNKTVRNGEGHTQQRRSRAMEQGEGLKLE